MVSFSVFSLFEVQMYGNKMRMQYSVTILFIKELGTHYLYVPTQPSPQFIFNYQL